MVTGVSSRRASQILHTNGTKVIHYVVGHYGFPSHYDLFSCNTPILVYISVSDIAWALLIAGVTNHTRDTCEETMMSTQLP